MEESGTKLHISLVLKHFVLFPQKLSECGRVSLSLLCSSPCWLKGRRKGYRHIYWKAFTWRFGFERIRISQIQTTCQKQSSGGCPRVYICIALFIPSWLLPLCQEGNGGLYTIGVGLSALLVSTGWAMREPWYVERATGLLPRFFC